MDDLISVIVPIYKVQPYLKKCVDSIVNQTYKNLEIILVDDGSPDNCGVICDEYAKKDQRIRVIHKENGGLSDARNAGLDIMQGDYVAFVDSDDWLPLDAIEILHKEAVDTMADIIVGECIRIDENGEIILKNSNMKDGSFTTLEWMQHVLINGCAAWAQLHKKDVYESCRFPVGEINEDEAVVLKVLEKCEKIAVTTKCVYYYRCRKNSITTNVFSKKKLAWKEHCAANWKFTKNNYPEIETFAMMRYRNSLIWSLTQIALSEEPEIYKKEIEDMMNELRKNRRVFAYSLFSNKKELFRLEILCIFGFEIYKKLIVARKKR